MERLTEKTENGYVLKIPKDKNISDLEIKFNVYDKLGAYEDAEEQGLLLRTQVAIGQTVFTNTTVQGWYMRKSKRPYEATVVYIGINGVDNYMNVDFKDGYMLNFPFSQIGKTVFLTREEAEKALADMGV